MFIQEGYSLDGSDWGIIPLPRVLAAPVPHVQAQVGIKWFSWRGQYSGDVARPQLRSQLQHGVARRRNSLSVCSTCLCNSQETPRLARQGFDRALRAP